MEHNRLKNVFLMLGSNKGNREENIERGIALIGQEVGRVVLSSSLYETEPWGKMDQEWFLNRALLIESKLDSFVLLHRLLDIEKKLGRIRSVQEKYGPRELDIDILYYEKMVICREELKIPHPEIINRRFVLEPLNEIAAQWLDPVHQKTVAQLLAMCKDKGIVRKVQ